MALKKRGKYRYGDGPEDIATEIRRCSKENAYVATELAAARCTCGGDRFELELDETQGAAVRICVACAVRHPIGDSDEYLEEAELEACSCLCGEETFEITVGVSLYADSAAVRWLYVGCRCPACGLTGVYRDWKNEHEDHVALLARV